MTAKSAIRESITRDRIVTLDYDADLVDELSSLCDDSVEAYGLTEYWGTDEDGDSWRVHVVDEAVDDDDDDTDQSETVPYQIEAEMLGPDFAGTASDLHEFVEILASETGRPTTDFVVRQHLGQSPGAEEPNDAEWDNALQTFMGRRPELFAEVAS